MHACEWEKRKRGKRELAERGRGEDLFLFPMPAREESKGEGEGVKFSPPY